MRINNNQQSTIVKTFLVVTDIIICSAFWYSYELDGPGGCSNVSLTSQISPTCAITKMTLEFQQNGTFQLQPMVKETVMV